MVHAVRRRTGAQLARCVCRLVVMVAAMQRPQPSGPVTLTRSTHHARPHPPPPLFFPLLREAPVEADVVSTVPTTSTPAALGYAYQAGIPYNEVLSKNRYVGRTFIQPDQR